MAGTSVDAPRTFRASPLACFGGCRLCLQIRPESLYALSIPYSPPPIYCFRVRAQNAQPSAIFLNGLCPWPVAVNVRAPCHAPLPGWGGSPAATIGCGLMFIPLVATATRGSPFPLRKPCSPFQVGPSTAIPFAATLRATDRTGEPPWFP